MSLFPGVGISGYKSFGPDIQVIAPLERINVLVGPNNSGKSTTLGFFIHHLSQAHASLTTNSAMTLEPTYRRRVVGEPAIPFRVRWPISDSASLTGTAYGQTIIDFIQGKWPTFAQTEVAGPLRVEEEFLLGLTALLDLQQWREVALSVIGQASSSQRENAEALFTRYKVSWLVPPPNVVPIPAHRQITAQRADGTIPSEWDPSGAGLLRQLDGLNRPKADDIRSFELHEKLLSDVKSVLELDDFSYHVALDTNQLVLTIDGETRDLDAVGTGYEHILLLVGAAIIHPHAFLCVEEPEVHMHPRLQRRLADYLRNSTENQMLISTHSATLIDALRGDTFRVALKDYSTMISRPVESDLLDVFGDLGYRASDLLQSNCVIWVEGASDRIYLKHWLQQIDSTLEEGIDYSIMFYGGSMIAHISLADEADEEDRVPLRRLNQRFVLVADSDMKTSEAPLQERVERLLSEAEGHPHGRLWVTKGRTIENYLDAKTLAKVVMQIHPSVTEVIAPESEWDDPLVAVGKDGESLLKVDKVKLARHITRLPANLEPLDLEDRLGEVVEVINEANA